MRGYEDDLDEYEEYEVEGDEQEDGYEYEDDGAAYEEEGEEEDEEEEEEEEEVVVVERKPTQEELEYLELRQRLKDSIRKKMKKENSSARMNLQEKKRKLPYDNYGSFFGPSQPVIAQRVIQESKSLLENQHLASRMLNSKQSSKRAVTSNSAGSKSGSHGQPHKVVTAVQKKVEKLKDTRDYSFLFSDDAEPSASRKEHQPQNISVPNYEAWSAHMSVKSKQPLGNSARSAHVGHEGKKSAPINSQMHYKTASFNGQMHSKSASSSGQKLASSSGQMHSKLASSSGQMHSKSASSSGQMHYKSAYSSGQMHSRSASSSGQMHSKPGSLNGQMHSKSGSLNGPMHHSRSSSGSLNGLTNHARTGSSNGHVHSKSSSVHGPMHSKPSSLNTASSSKSNLKPTDFTKHVGSNSGIGPGRPTVAKTLPPKTPVATLERKASVSGAKNPLPSGQKLPSSKMQSIDPRKHTEQRKGANEPNRPKIISKQPAASSKPQMNKPLKQVSSHIEHRPKKKPVKRSEDEMALDMIRNMFNTKRYADRDIDDSDDMEANFDDILREERRSTRIARKEDEEQLRLIEEEERQERMRKLAKKRKLSH